MVAIFLNNIKITIFLAKEGLIWYPDPRQDNIILFMVARMCPQNHIIGILCFFVEFICFVFGDPLDSERRPI